MIHLNSLRLKLLGWYTFVTGSLAVVAGLLLFLNADQTTYAEIDAALRSNANALAKATTPFGNNKFDIDMKADQVSYFRSSGKNASHAAIWTSEGNLIDETHPSLEVTLPSKVGIRERSGFREFTRRGPSDIWILVGREVKQQQEQLQHFGSWIVFAGGIGMAVMLAGGWFITSRALAPIARISKSVSSVSASNLSERIDVSHMEVEFIELASGVNNAFDRLENAFERQAQFTADASHELRTPLTIVLAQADLALRKNRTEQEYQKFLATINRASIRMKKVVEGLLTLARADSRKIDLDMKDFDLKPLVEETINLMLPLAKEMKVQFVQELDSVMFVGDRDRIGEAVANVIANAIRYNQADGEVKVCLYAKDQQIQLDIADTGRGIAEDEQVLIFSRFYRCDQSRARTVDGTGLGLAITKWIIEAHGGTIGCQSRETAGTIFTINFEQNNSSDNFATTTV